MEFEQIVKAAAMGEQRAWRALEKRLQPKLRKWFAAQYPELDRSDLIQETLCVISTKLPTFEVQRESSFMAWVRRIARYKALAALRARKQRDELEAMRKRNPKTPRTGLSSRIYRAERIERVRCEADKLPNALRVAAANMLEGGDTDELAELAGIKRSSAQRREERAAERLRERLRPATPET
jgi:RNA polymerase sigma factor (sigma-70 family)